VGELAERSGISVDTVRFYQKRGLLPAPDRAGRVAFYGPGHEERLARIRDLAAQGFNLAVIRRLLNGELQPADMPLVAAVTEADAGDALEDSFSLEEVAARANVPFVLVEAVANEGLMVPRLHRGEPRYTEADVDMVRAAVRLLETGLPLPELLAIARRYHDATREFAEGAVELFDEHVRRPLLNADLPAEARADQLVDAFRVLFPSVSALVAHHFRRVLLSVAQEHIEAVGEPAERTAVEAEAIRTNDGRLA
jgi:DNA-binding transcriptional MerR regulator